MDRRQSLLAAAGRDFRVPAVKYDGSTNNLQMDANFAAANDVGLISFWFRVDGGDGSGRWILDSAVAGNDLTVKINTSNKIELYWSLLGTENHFRSVSSFLASSVWHHCMLSWDSNVAQHLYIDGSNELDVVVNTDTDTPFTLDNLFSTTTIGNHFNGGIAQFYATDEYMDLSVASNRLKFYDIDARVIDLGADGSTPTGTPPRILINSTAPNYPSENNLGAAGDFTISGTLVNTYAPS